MASALISTPTTALHHSLRSSDASVHVHETFDTAMPFVDEVLEVSPVQSGVSFSQTVDIVIPHSAPMFNDSWLKVTLPALTNADHFYIPKAGYVLLKTVKIFVGAQLIHEYNGHHDAIYGEFEDDNRCAAGQGPNTLYIPIRIATGHGRKFAVPLHKLRCSGNDMKLQITYASQKEITASYVDGGLHTNTNLTSTVSLDTKLILRYVHIDSRELALHPNSFTWAGKYVQHYHVSFESGKAIRLPFTGICYELIIVVRDKPHTDNGEHFWRFRPLDKIELKCDNIKHLELLRGVTSMDGTAAADVADALHPHPCSDIQPRNVGQFGTEFIYSLPFGTDVADNTKMFGGLDMGAFKTIELTLTTLKTYTSEAKPWPTSTAATTTRSPSPTAAPTAASTRVLVSQGGHSMMDIGEGSKKQRQALKNDLKADMDGIVNKYLPGTIMPEVPVVDGTKADIYTPEDKARGLGLSGGETKTLPAMKYTPSMEKLMRMGIRQQLQNANPGRTINEEDVENAFSLRKEIMIRDFDQWAMTAFDLKQPGVAKMLEEYYPELLERITNMIEQDIEIQRFDKYQKVFFPMNYDDLVMKWARERGWIKTMEEIEKENLLGPAGRYGRRRRTPGLRAGYTPDLSPMFNAQTANISSAVNKPYGRNDNLLPRVVNPLPALQSNQLATRSRKGAWKRSVQGGRQITMLAETNARKAEMYDLAARALRPGQ
eukprot:tig00000342_g24267.t1